MKFHKTALSTMALALIGPAALAGTGFSSWNVNGGNTITRSEWNQAFDANGVFEKLDENNSGIFEVEESDDNFLQYDFALDLNEDMKISRDEVENGLFLMYDSNDNQVLSRNEFSAFGEKLENLMM